MSRKYVTATDITPNRCTVTGVYSSEQAAQAAIESDDEQGCFEYLITADGEEPAEGARIYSPRWRSAGCSGSGRNDLP